MDVCVTEPTKLRLRWGRTLLVLDWLWTCVSVGRKRERRRGEGVGRAFETSVVRDTGVRSSILEACKDLKVQQDESYYPLPIVAPI